MITRVGISQTQRSQSFGTRYEVKGANLPSIFKAINKDPQITNEFISFDFFSKTHLDSVLGKQSSNMKTGLKAIFKELRNITLVPSLQNARLSDAFGESTVINIAPKATVKTALEQIKAVLNIKA